MNDKPIKFDSEQVKTKTNTQGLDNLDELLSDNTKQLPAGINSSKLLQPKKKTKLLKIFAASLSLLIVSAATYEAWQFIQEMFAINPILGGAVSTLVGVVVFTGLGAFIKGRIKSKRLREREVLRESLKVLQTNGTYGKAKSMLDDVSQEFQQEVDISKSLALYQQSLQQSHNDAELIQIYSDQVLSGLDRLALEAINKHATESALMVALSPLAAADMALVAWRSSKMLQDISRIYGCPQTAFGRLGLTKQVATNLMLAGASELIADASVELLGKSVAATVSTKVAQGIGVGILISRFGIQTMRLCRPIEFTNDNKPKLSDVRKLITTKVISLVTAKNKDQILKQGEKDDRA
ncbi:MAG: TIGR01620 family protein [Gammaproteobacteria bacterium]|nr:TIGR01620 family protein [Gammaproteobacteria bacterium]